MPWSVRSAFESTEHAIHAYSMQVQREVVWMRVSRPAVYSGGPSVAAVHLVSSFFSVAPSCGHRVLS